MRIIGLGVCGPNEADRFLKRTLDEFKRLCDDVVICTNNAGIKEKRLIREYGFKQYEDNREWGVFQPRIKQDFLERIGFLRPDWCIFLDMDEFFDKRFTREKAEELASKEHDVAYFFWFLELWDRTDQYNEGYTFEDVRFFKYIPELGFQLRGTPLHCGVYPEKVASWGTHTNLFVKHYGLLRKEDRIKKYERYKKYDPNAVYLPKYWYEGLLSKNPPLRKVEDFIEEISKMKFQFKNRPMPQMRQPNPNEPKKVWRFINPHGELRVFTEERYYLQRLNMPKWKFLGEEVLEDTSLKITKENPLEQLPIEKDPLECKICGFLGKNKQSLRMHKNKKGHK